jgi:hypothetical protein
MQVITTLANAETGQTFGWLFLQKMLSKICNITLYYITLHYIILPVFIKYLFNFCNYTQNWIVFYMHLKLTLQNTKILDDEGDTLSREPLTQRHNVLSPKTGHQSTGMRRITTFRSTTDRIYDGDPIR